MRPRSIRATQTCAGLCWRLELVPSRAAFWIGLGWLGGACGAVLATGFSWPVRVGICGVLVAVIWRALDRSVRLRGPRAPTALEWSGGELFVLTAAGGRRLPAALGIGCQRLGPRWWILRLETPEGPLAAVLDASMLDPAAIRRFARHLDAYRRGEADTIRPKV